jgi:hypothetical protein
MTTHDTDTTQTTKATNKGKRAGRDSLFTTLWGWFTAPRFGAAGSGGLEYEPFPHLTDEFAVAVKR